jgi:acetyl/propionyl-CoA carboxylase alpha subunit
MARALDEMVIRGVETCIPFHRRVMDEQDFGEGNLSIQYLEEHPDLMQGPEEEDLLRAAATAAAILRERERTRLQIRPPSEGAGTGFSAWKRAGWPFYGQR